MTGPYIEKRSGEDRRWSPPIAYAIIQAAEDRGLHPADVRIYIRLYTELDTQTWRELKQGWVAKRMGMAKTHVSRSFRRLINRGYLEREGPTAESDYRVYRYRLTQSPTPPPEASRPAA